MRKVAAVVVAGAALWLAPGALAAGWCGTGEVGAERPDVTTGQQVHPVVVLPADSPDTFPAVANKLADDVVSLSAWWIGQDATRVPRFDQALFPGGTCLDISFVRLSEKEGALLGAGAVFQRVGVELSAAGFSNTYKKYFVYYDGPSVQANVCGAGAGDFAQGPALAVVWLRGCPGAPADSVGAHELLHSLGALPAGARNPCPGDPGHPCDAPFVDVLSSRTDGRPLQQQVLDVNHDDYYAHSGSWNDLQDSAWLSHLDTPQVPLTVALTGPGTVTSDLPGLLCSAVCTTLWDQGSTVTLVAAPGPGLRLVRWAGACAGSAVCSIRLAEAQAVTAVFGPATVPIRVTAAGRGKVVCTPVCSRSFPAGDPVTLRAVPAKGWKFTGWSGGCKGKRLVCRPSTAAAVNVRATFRRR